MPLDWLKTLGVADQSLDAQLAKRDLSKKAALVQNLAKMQEDVRSQREAESFKRDQLQEQMLLRKATMDQTQQYRDQMRQDRQDAEDRQSYNTAVDNLRAGVQNGVVPKISDPKIKALIERFEGSGNITPDMANAGGGQVTSGEAGDQGAGGGEPTSWFYMQQAAENMIHKAEQARKAQEHSQKLQDETQSRQNEMMALQKEKWAEEQKMIELRKRALEDRHSKALKDFSAGNDDALRKVPGASQEIVKRAKEITDAQKGIWSLLTPEEQKVNEAEAYAQAVEDVRAALIKKGQLAGGPPLSTGAGRGGAPAGGGGLKPGETRQVGGVTIKRNN